MPEVATRSPGDADSDNGNPIHLVTLGDSTIDNLIWQDTDAAGVKSHRKPPCLPAAAPRADHDGVPATSRCRRPAALSFC